ncbi:MAG: CAP domain-containing protein [Patescibacteria group bacterium]|nr:CAP domain-containing protein [Patescibacteria group bacterium]
MRNFKIAFLILTIILGSTFLFWDNILDFYSLLSLQLPKVEKETILIEETEKQVFTPPPLRAKEEVPESFLTQAGIIKWTNIQRQEYGLLSLKEDTKLNTAAEVKAQDMFSKQYFTHVSPLGVGVGDLVESAGYEFLIVGENLALGNFQNDEMLVQAWMDSPGHRDNILNGRYQEIGVAVVRGTFEGAKVWMAVQHFALPLSVCPQPDEIVKEEIDLNQSQIKELLKTADRLLSKIKTMRPKRGAAYKEAVEQYNALVAQYNALIEETQVLASQYNIQVNIFNQCVAGVE